MANPLLAPVPKGLDAAAPDSFLVQFATSRGDVGLMVYRAWSPRGADRVHWLVTHGFYDGARFFRAVKDFVVQFGLSGDTAVTRAWRDRSIADDSVRASNARGMVTFAKGGPNSRTTQLYINLRDNARLDALGFSPVGRIVSGLDVVDSLYMGYGEGPPRGAGPAQERIVREGEAYLAREFPKLDRVVTARVVQGWRAKR
ncbi:MAG: peptidylprolyl isomerase [Gemmatimonadaceae bacterium]|nr:peptidylprolyl isomerase [Gemmatimonadaceae bacterium]